MNEFIGKWRSFITEDKTPLRENFEVGDIVVFRGDQLKGEEMTVVGKRKMFAVKDNGRDLMAIQVELPDGSTSEYDETQLVKVRGGDRVRAGVRSAAEKLGMKPSHIDESLAEGYEIGDEVILRGNSTGDYVFTIVDSRKMFGSNLMAYTVKDKNTGDVMEYDETQLAAIPTIMMADEFDVEDEDDESTKRRRNHQAQSSDIEGYVDDPSNPLGEPRRRNHQAQSMDIDGYVDDPSNPLGEPNN